MIVKFDSLNRFETPALYVCNPGCKYIEDRNELGHKSWRLTKVLGALSGTTDEELVLNFNAISELNFRAYNLAYEDRAEREHAYTLYKALQNRRLIFVEDVGFFMITNVSSGYKDGIYYKDIIAESCESEIASKIVPYIADGTYMFYDPEDSNSLLYKLVETLPMWTIAHVDETIATKYRTFESVSTDLNVYAFMNNNVQEAYECIFIFDIKNRTISVYDQETYVTLTSIHITKDDLIDSIEIKEDMENVYTAISVLGSDDLSINAVNPLGTNVIYNFSYYLDWMSDELREKITRWQEEVSAAESEYLEYAKAYYDLLEISSEQRSEIDRLETLIDIYTRCYENIVAEGNLDDTNGYMSAAIEYGGTNIISTDIKSTREAVKICIDSLNNDLASLKARYEDSDSDSLESIVFMNMSPEELKATVGNSSLNYICRNGPAVSNTTSGSGSSEDEDDEKLSDTTFPLYKYVGDEWVFQRNVSTTSLIGYLSAAMDLFRTTLSITNYFNETEYEELYNYIFEGSYTDEYIAVTSNMTYADILSQTDLLYTRAKSQLERISKPTQEFSIDVENFVFEKDFEEWSDQLETGCAINVDIGDNDVAQLFLSSITINYDDKSLELTFGNRLNKFDPKSIYSSVLGSVQRTANTLSYIKDVIYPIETGELNELRSLLESSRTLTKTAVLSAENQSFVIDDTGLTGRTVNEDGTFGKRQVKLTSNTMVFTDDNWDTAKVALGEIIINNENKGYGLNAEVVMGDLLVGGGLNIMSVDSEGNQKAFLEVINGMITSQVDEKSEIGQAISSLKQTADKIELSFTTTTSDDGKEVYEPEVDSVTTSTGYTFDRDGLLISDSDSDIINQINNTGMYVKTVTDTSSGDTTDVLTANNQGVFAINLHSERYLVVGDSARFEDYIVYHNDENGNSVPEKRTGCYYVGMLTDDELYGDAATLSIQEG